MGKVSDALERYKKETAIQTDKLFTRADGESVPQGPEMPQNVNPKVVVLSARDSLEAEIFKVLRAQILFPKDLKRPRTIMVTSAFPGEGKTFVAANLGVTMATGVDEHVLLVDCDFRRPNLHNMLGYSNTEGLREHLTGKRQLFELIIRTNTEKLSLLTAGASGPNPSELLSSAAMQEFLQEVKERYQDRYIIIDTPPSHVIGEVSVLARHVDAIIFVVLANTAPRDIIQRSVENLGKERILGIVFNGYSESYRSYYKYYGKYYK